MNNRAIGIAILVGLGVAALIAWGIQSNVEDRDARHAADREAWEASHQAGPSADAEQRVTLVARFRKQLRANIEELLTERPDTDEAFEAALDDLRAEAEQAKTKAVREAADTTDLAGSQLDEWEQDLESKAQKIWSEAGLPGDVYP